MFWFFVCFTDFYVIRCDSLWNYRISVGGETYRNNMGLYYSRNNIFMFISNINWRTRYPSTHAYLLYLADSETGTYRFISRYDTMWNSIKFVNLGICNVVQALLSLNTNLGFIWLFWNFRNINGVSGTYTK